MNAIASIAVCDWDGKPAHRPLTGIGLGCIVGRVVRGRMSVNWFAPRERQEMADATFEAAQIVWKLAQERGIKGAVVEATWVDCCGHRHMLFSNGVDCRILIRAPSVAASYAAALAAAPARMKAIAAGQEQTIEPVRHGRDIVVGQWTDPVQTNKYSREPEKVRGFRRVDSLVVLHRKGTLTKEHVAAGFRLRDDYEMSEGARMGSERSEVRGSSGPGGPADAQLAACARYRAAIQAVGQRQSGILIEVALNNRTVTEWAERQGMALSRATGYLEAALDRLRDHYGGSLSANELARAEEG